MRNSKKSIAIFMGFILAIPLTFFLLAKVAGSKVQDKDEAVIESEWNAISKSTKDKVVVALKSIMHIGSKVEIGVNRPNYSTAVTEAHASIKLLEYSEEFKDIPQIMKHLNSALRAYIMAGGSWDKKLENESLRHRFSTGGYEYKKLTEFIRDNSDSMQRNWEYARVEIQTLSRVILK